jgi:hypothetical protein
MALARAAVLTKASLARWPLHRPEAATPLHNFTNTDVDPAAPASTSL